MDAQYVPIGYAWLIRTLGLSVLPLTHESYIGARARSDATRPGIVQELFPQNYWPGDEAFDHLVFALKYDDFNLDVLRQTFAKLGPEHLLARIEAQPNGRYARQLGYLYELLTGDQLPLTVTIGGSVVELLDRERYFVAPNPRKNPRWRVSDNLLGSVRFCPVVRRTPAIQTLLKTDFGSRLQSFKDKVDPALFRRALDYLYFKETRSSYDIEHEKPTPDREQRFVRALQEAGKAPFENVLSEAELTTLQNLIVEPRYAQSGFRNWQNYVGESVPGRSPVVHYVCPPGQMVRDLMTGLIDCAARTEGIHPVVRAAVMSFGFVFMHPFEDGNGRIHRFLIHDFLGRDGLVPAGMVLPVSAHMLHHPIEYDNVLESFSKPLRSVVRITLDDEEQLTINNPEEASGSYRYPDLTRQAHYLLTAVEQTINTELVSEILFIRGYDRAKLAIREVIDMPDRRMDLLIKLLHQNKGVLSAKKRSQFAEIDDEEMLRIQSVFAEAFDAEGFELDA
jgi:Fic family protein